ncbi:MAG: hypothetical protein K6G09_04080 [Treponema sp.]|nr:hypothetical protein [Treponema sp.]
MFGKEIWILLIQNFQRVFKISKEKFASVTEGDAIYLVFPHPGEILSTTTNVKPYYEIFNSMSSQILLDEDNSNYNAQRCILSAAGVDFVKANGLEIFADCNKLVKVLIGSATICDYYLYELNNLD